MKQVKPDGTVPLTLTEAERRLILEDLMYVEDQYTNVIRATAKDRPVKFTLDDWEGLGGCIAAEADHARDKRLKKELDRLIAKIEALFDQHPDDLPALKIYRGEEDHVPGDTDEKPKRRPSPHRKKSTGADTDTS